MHQLRKLALFKKQYKSGIKKTKKSKKTKNKVKTKKKLSYFDILKHANTLQKNPPKSEVWFQSLFKTYKLESDQYNTEFKYSIPDVINHFYKYIIEIDGSIHSLPEIKENDRRKELKYKNQGYKVLRVKAYNIVSFNNALNTRQDIIKSYNKK